MEEFVGGRFIIESREKMLRFLLRATAPHNANWGKEEYSW
jgi:hypothetical protein